MKKINQEEYEVLKRLDSRWKWIAVNSKGWLLGFTSMPDKKIGGWSNGEQQLGFFNDKVNGLDRELFRFIQSSGPEPYNIAELIEEYERGGIEVSKDKLWAKNKIQEELESWRNIEGGIDEDGINYVLNIIDQINEPEVLTQEIDRQECDTRPRFGR